MQLRPWGQRQVAHAAEHKVRGPVARHSLTCRLVGAQRRSYQSRHGLKRGRAVNLRMGHCGIILAGALGWASPWE
jgi:hypothetical protein